MLKKERGLREDPIRLYLQSETGYLNIDLFSYIMEEFTKRWKITRPGLDCFMICDNLSVHRSDDVVTTARLNGIHLINIMPGSSNWFQVHDQEPFGLLKKSLREEIITNPVPISASRDVRKTVTLAMFYKAEKKALAPSVVKKAFNSVGLSPWNPEKILKMCREHSSVPAHLISSDVMRAATVAIRECEQKKIEMLREMMASLKPVQVKLPKKAVKKSSPDLGSSESLEGKGKRRAKSTDPKNKEKPIEPPQKRPRGRPRKNVQDAAK